MNALENEPLVSASKTATSRTTGSDPSRSWDHWKSQAPLLGGFVLLLAIGAGFVWLFVSSHQFNESVAHTLEVQNTAYRLLSLVQDAETGERGYLLTDNTDYLRPYDIGRTEAPHALAELQALVARNEMQTETITRLRQSIGAKLEDLAFTVGTNMKGGHKEAIEHVKLNIGNDLMQQVRVEVGRIETEEERVQNAQSRAADFSNRLLAIASLVAILIVFGLATYSIYATRRATLALMKAQDDLRDTNENLEGLVAERVSELQVANEEIQRFAYIVSHDLRAPLVNVMGFTAELEAARTEIASFLNDVAAKDPALVTADRRMAVETDLPEALGFIRSSTAKMDRLINAILKLSREGRRVLTPQTVELRPLLEAQGESLTHQLQGNAATLTIQKDLPDIVSDKLAVEQIFGNLIENAIKYLSPGRPGQINVTGHRHGGYLSYDIVDNGRGIDKKDFERIFELFRRSGEQDQPGEGIGLAYVRNLARRLGGNVSVKSEFGTGSTFTVTLPAVFSAKVRSK